MSHLYFTDYSTVSVCSVLVLLIILERTPTNGATAD
jgi:hypothetical protein